MNVCPKVSMAGHTVVGRKTFLGIGCTIIDGIRIGTEATVGAGAVGMCRTTRLWQAFLLKI